MDDCSSAVSSLVDSLFQNKSSYSWKLILSWEQAKYLQWNNFHSEIRAPHSDLLRDCSSRKTALLVFPIQPFSNASVLKTLPSSNESRTRFCGSCLNPQRFWQQGKQTNGLCLHCSHSSHHCIVLTICGERWFICSILRDAAAFSPVKDFPLTELLWFTSFKDLPICILHGLLCICILHSEGISLKWVSIFAVLKWDSLKTPLAVGSVRSEQFPLQWINTFSRESSLWGHFLLNY